MNNRRDPTDAQEADVPKGPLHVMTEDEKKAYKAILLCAGPIVALSCLLSKSKLRGITVQNKSGVALGRLIFHKISTAGIGTVKSYRRNNNSTVSLTVMQNM